MIVSITISRGSFVFSQARVKVSASLTNVGSLAVGAFDLVSKCNKIGKGILFETVPFLLSE